MLLKDILIERFISYFPKMPLQVQMKMLLLVSSRGITGLALESAHSASVYN